MNQEPEMPTKAKREEAPNLKFWQKAWGDIFSKRDQDLITDPLTDLSKQPTSQSLYKVNTFHLF